MIALMAPKVTDCRSCTLRRKSLFRPLVRPELAFLAKMKDGEVLCGAGNELIAEGSAAVAIYTLLDGWAIRYVRQSANRRQILAVLLPGDTVGITGAVTGTNKYSVAALTSSRFCVLQRQTLQTMRRSLPSFALDLLRTQLDDEQWTCMSLARSRQQAGDERVGSFTIELYDRLRLRDMVEGTSCDIPLRGIDIADVVGLSRVHAARALRRLRDLDLAHLRRGRLTLPDPKRLADHVGYSFQSDPARRTIL